MQGGNTEVTDNKYDENRSVQLKLSELDLLRESIEMKIERQRRIWSKNITRFLYSNYKSESSMAKDINQNPETIFRWMQGELPIGRSVILQTGIANCEDLRELNNFIGKSGRSFYLNPLDCEDSIIMYIMKDETIDKNNASYESICERIKYLLSGKSNFFGKHENALLDFVSGRGMLFDNAMEILYDYIRNDNIKNDNIELKNNLLNSESRIKPFIPCRDKVIACGIRKGISVPRMNRLLLDMKMEPLYYNNPFEASIIYAIKKHEIVKGCIKDTDLKEYVITELVDLGFNNTQVADYFDAQVI